MSRQGHLVSEGVCIDGPGIPGEAIELPDGSLVELVKKIWEGHDGAVVFSCRPVPQGNHALDCVFSDFNKTFGGTE